MRGCDTSAAAVHAGLPGPGAAAGACSASNAAPSTQCRPLLHLALTALTSLNMAGNCTIVSSGYCGCSLQRLRALRGGLRELSLSECILSTIPSILSRLTALTSLDLSGNPALSSGWDHLLCLPSLHCLDLLASMTRVRCHAAEIMFERDQSFIDFLLPLEVRTLRRRGVNVII